MRKINLKKLWQKSFIFGILCVLLILTSWSLAQEKSSSPSATETTIDEEKVKALKEKLATKVAEIRSAQTRGFSGEIAQIAKSSFTLVTITQEVKVKYADDVLIFKKTGMNQVEAKLTDLKNTVTGSVLGIYDKDINQITAKVVLLEDLPKFYIGKILIVDSDKNTLTIKNNGNKDNEIDYAKTTIAQEYKASDDTIVKSGLSKMEAGDEILVWGAISEEDNQKVIASKIFRLPKAIFSASNSASLQTPAPSKSATPSAQTKATPKASPTLKATPKTSPKPSAS